MRLERLNGWQSLCLVASMVWVAAVALYAIWRHGSDVERLRYWADSIEWSINADPMIEASAKQLRARLGDERFITAAAAAYPRVALRETLQRYEAEEARRPREKYDAVSLVFWSLLPPGLLHAAGLIAACILGCFRRSKDGRSAG
jgi:hypothetical protein